MEHHITFSGIVLIAIVTSSRYGNLSDVECIIITSIISGCECVLKYRIRVIKMKLKLLRWTWLYRLNIHSTCGDEIGVLGYSKSAMSKNQGLSSDNP